MDVITDAVWDGTAAAAAGAITDADAMTDADAATAATETVTGNKTCREMTRQNAFSGGDLLFGSPAFL
ncbi:hypothetical protein AALB39_19920 [Lachnospiraceae bacterium 54-53]